MKEEVDPMVVAALRDKFAQKGIRKTFLDLDETLIFTSGVIHGYIEEFARFVADRTPFTQADITDFFISVVIGTKGTFQVNPEIMKYAAHITLKRAGLEVTEGELASLLQNLMRIYRPEKVEKIPGVDETLEMLTLAGQDLVLVTHGSRDYTYHKVEKAGLRWRFEHIIPVDDLVKKDHIAWSNAFTKAEVLPTEVLLLGDNWDADMAQAAAAGVPVEHLVCVRSPLGTYHFSHKKVEGVVELDDIRKVIPHVLTL